MTNEKSTSSILVKLFALVSICTLFQCLQEDQFLTPSTSLTGTSEIAGVTTTSAATLASCGCTFTVPSNSYLVDGAALALKPGSVICLSAGNVYKNILFRNIKGTALAPITIKNCGGSVNVGGTVNADGTVNVTGTGRTYTIKAENSQFFRITGGTGTTNGIRIIGGHQGIALELFTSNFEVDHVEISHTGFAGIMAKTNPTCDDATIRGNFVMRNVLIHDNYIHDTGGEGLYIGSSFYANGQTTPCGVRMPHIIEGVKIYNNFIKNSGWESIQVGSAPKGAEVYNNRIENYGVLNVTYQNNGVQFGEGAPGKFYGNLIKGGKGKGLILIGNAENFVHDNVIINAGTDGIFCDERTAVGPGFKFVNNTIINPGTNGITIYAETVPMNHVVNNIIVNPGNYSKLVYPRTANEAYIYLLSKTTKLTNTNNIFTRDINTVKFVSPSAFNYDLTSTSPAVEKGANIAAYNVLVDFIMQPRLKGAAYDIGAHEF